MYSACTASQGHSLGPGAQVHLPGLASILLSFWHFGEPLVWLPPAIQWPEGRDESEPGEHPALLDGEAPRGLELPPAMGGICLQLTGVCGHQPIPLHCLAGLPASSRRRLQSQLFERTFSAAGLSVGWFVHLSFVPPCIQRSKPTIAGLRPQCIAQDSRSGCPPRIFGSRSS